ncbi:acyltransferase family protein [Christiangramia salexigens]|uniref:Acyltransferase 3 domain-containing protein n=1 Tax=Christiangramia salexigens TaxID=1913577 RepID=A0A1L3J887_9FLAO|nr:hypothetical protein LPB144_13260 [Christiangramia salexigens]
MIENFKVAKIEGIDSLRFFAFLMVFLFHSSDLFYFGFLGVDFFFVLSSFLLTFLALKEMNSFGSFSKKNFFMRRVLRIFPLYYLILFFSFILLPLVAQFIKLEISLPENQYLFWIFLSNFDDSAYLLPLKFLWSIAVEEQFYLLFLFLSIYFRNNIWHVIGGLLLIYLLYYYANEFYGWAHYKNLFYHFPNFAIGMAGGWVFYNKKYSMVGILILLSLTSIFLAYIDPASMIFNINLSLWFVSIIFATHQFSVKTGNYKVLKIFNFLGQYTYGLYLYSGFVIIIFNTFQVFEQFLLQTLLELLCIFIISFTSYHLFEKRFLSLKENFRQPAAIRNK